MVRRVVRASPVEETEGFSTRVGASAKDSENELGIEVGDSELVESALQVEVAADNVGDMVDCGEIVVFGRSVGAIGGGN